MWASVGLCVWKTREGDFQRRSLSALTPRASASSVGFKNTRFYSETTPFGAVEARPRRRERRAEARLEKEKGGVVHVDPA